MKISNCTQIRTLIKVPENVLGLDLTKLRKLIPKTCRYTNPTTQNKTRSSYKYSLELSSVTTISTKDGNRTQSTHQPCNYLKWLDTRRSLSVYYVTITKRFHIGKTLWSVSFWLWSCHTNVMTPSRLLSAFVLGTRIFFRKGTQGDLYLPWLLRFWKSLNKFYDRFLEIQYFGTNLYGSKKHWIRKCETPF